MLRRQALQSRLQSHIEDVHASLSELRERRVPPLFPVDLDLRRRHRETEHQHIEWTQMRRDFEDDFAGHGLGRVVDAVRVEQCPVALNEQPSGLADLLDCDRKSIPRPGYPNGASFPTSIADTPCPCGLSLVSEPYHGALGCQTAETLSFLRRCEILFDTQRRGYYNHHHE